MRQILFEIPLETPWFGFGYFLLAWTVFGLITLRCDWQRLGGMSDELKQSIAFWIVVAGAIVFVPKFAPMPTLPVYGYGAMLVTGALLSGWVAATRSKLVGVDPQFAWDMSVKLILAGRRTRIFPKIMVSTGRIANGAIPLPYQMPLRGRKFHGRVQSRRPRLGILLAVRGNRVPGLLGRPVGRSVHPGLLRRIR